MEFEIELPRDGLPTDREITGIRWAVPKQGDYILTDSGTWKQTLSSWTGFSSIIADLSPVEVWRPATTEDAIRALRGETVRCRGWDGNGNEKWMGVLTGKIPTDIYPWGVTTDSYGSSCYTHCEVLDTCK